MSSMLFSRTRGLRVVFTSGIFLVAAMSSLYFGCSEKTPENFLGSGTLEARQIRVGSLVSGKLLRLGFGEGDRVARGDTLAVIDVETLKLKKKQLEARFDEIEAGRKAVMQEIDRAEENLRNIEKKYRRIRELFSKGSATQQQMDDISSQKTLAASRLESARTRLETLDAQKKELEASVRVLEKQIADGVVLSPTMGVVAQKYFEEGEILRVGAPLYRIVDREEFWLRIFVAETELGKIAEGDTVEVRVDGVAEPMPGVIAWVSPEAEFTPKNVQTRNARAELVYAVKVRLIEKRDFLKIGMPAEVYMQ